MKYQYAVGRVLDHFPGLKPDDVAWRLRQSTFVSVRKRYLYFEILKAASTQMIELLRAVENAPSMKAFVDGQQETRRAASPCRSNPSAREGAPTAGDSGR